MSLALSDYVTFQLILFIPYSLMRGFSFFFFPRMVGGKGGPRSGCLEYGDHLMTISCGHERD